MDVFLFVFTRSAVVSNVDDITLLIILFVWGGGAAVSCSAPVLSA